jgi:hypothetical protein
MKLQKSGDIKTQSTLKERPNIFTRSSQPLVSMSSQGFRDESSEVFTKEKDFDEGELNVTINTSSTIFPLKSLTSSSQFSRVHRSPEVKKVGIKSDRILESKIAMNKNIHLQKPKKAVKVLGKYKS